MNKIERRLRRKRGIRKKIYGTAEKPRITVFKSDRYIYVQAIDDDKGQTLCTSSNLKLKEKKTVEGASKVGKDLGKKLLELKIEKAVFDRNGYVYHGLVKALADGVRKAGIKM